MFYTKIYYSLSSSFALIFTTTKNTLQEKCQRYNHVMVAKTHCKRNVRDTKVEPN